MNGIGASINEWDGGMERKGLRVPEREQPTNGKQTEMSMFSVVSRKCAPRFRGTRHPVAPGRMKCERDVGGEWEGEVIEERMKVPITGRVLARQTLHLRGGRGAG